MTSLRALMRSLLLLVALSFSTSVYGADKAKTLVFAIDGLSYKSFQLAQKRGLFPSFQRAGRHIAPYPSMTEPSWTEIMGGRELFPLQANAKTIEATHFDLDTMEVVDDPRLVFTRYASPFNFFRAFDYYFNPFVEGLMYFPTEGVNKMELDEIEKEALAHLEDTHYVSYVSSVDAIAHTQKDTLYPHLVKISATLERILAAHKAKGIPVDAWIISDHGNDGPFREGDPEVYISPVDLAELAERAGFELVEKVTEPHHVAAPVMALANVANFYFKDLSRRRAFAKAALENPAVELITFVEHDGKNFYVAILDAEGGEARLHWGERGYAYQTIRGNPLRLPERVSSSGIKWVGDKEMFTASAPGPYPDAPFRLVESATKQVENAPDLIVNFKRGFMAKGNFLEYVQMVRTHGSLNAASSLGVLASNGKAMPAYVRSHEVMDVIGLDSKTLFDSVSDLFHENPSLTVEKVRAKQKGGIETRVTDFSGDMIFRRIMKIVAATMDVFTPKDAKDFINAFGLKKQSNESEKLERAADVLKGIDPKSILNNIDQLLSLKDIPATTKDPKEMYGKFRDRLVNVPGLAPLQELLPSDLDRTSSAADKETLRNGANALRRTVMKLYTAPYLLDEILNIPEYDVVPDRRDVPFAANWLRQDKRRIVQNPTLVLEMGNFAPTLFSYVFQERQMVKELSPATFPLLFNPRPQDVTVVYVPGIYNEIFDREIFSRGLRALRENLGLRVLYADVDGRCESGVNANRILEFLKDDTRRRLERGYKRPQYLVLGYSKGGVDATEMLLLDQDFTRKQILGLFTIASPHRGTTIVESADLPAELLDVVTYRNTPSECRDKPGSKSVLRSTREHFWAKNLATLAGLTRFYSISFESSVADAHPWMKITKIIARFQSPNDGVVTVESSRFPEELGAVDFGVLNADHLAGILASKFPQDAFMEAALITLFELNALDPLNIRRWHLEVGAKAKSLAPDYYRRKLSGSVLAAVSATDKSPVNLTGPLPIGRTDEEAEWYEIIGSERAVLDSPLQCDANTDLSAFARAIDSNTRHGAFALKPIRFTCEDGKLHLHITIEERPFYKFWADDVVDQQEVKTMRDLISALLRNGLKSGENPLESEESGPSIPKSNRAPVVLPRNSIPWSADTVLDIKSFGSMLESATIDPIMPEQYPAGIVMIFDHQSMKEFRKEYGFFYESTSPGHMDDSKNGYVPVMDNVDGAEVPVLRMRSINNSTRISSAALRFKPADFPNLSLKLKVVKGPVGADSKKGGSGKDDSAFQVWFNLRNVKTVADRSHFVANGGVKVFGYHWDENAGNPAGTLFENYYSNKNFLVAVLPEAWQISIGNGEALGQWVDFRRNLLEDLRRAFPQDPAEDWEVVGITIQTDSNDTKSRSEAYFREMRLERAR